MILHTTRLLIGSLLLCCLSFLSNAHSEESPTLPTNATKYYEALKKSPSKSYLHSRFLDAWLESRPYSELPLFIEAKARQETADTIDLLIAGYFFSHRGDTEKALQYFETAIEQSPDQPAAHAEIAKLQAKALHFDDALRSLENALNSNTIEKPARLELGKLKGSYLFRTGQSDKAIATWEQLLTEHPTDLLLHEDIIEVLTSEGLLIEAIASAERLVEKTTDPYEQLIRSFRIAELHLLNNDHDAAIEQYTRILPNTGADTWVEHEVLSRVSSLFRQRDHIRGLKEWLTTQSQAHPQRLELIRAQAHLCAESNEPEEAIGHYEQLIEKSPGDSEIESGFIELLASLEQWDRAIKEQQAHIARSPERSAAHFRLAELHAVKHEYELAKDAALKALELSDRSTSDILRTAKFLERHSQVESAVDLLKASRLTAPEDKEVGIALAELLLSVERAEEGTSLLKDIAPTSSMLETIRIAELLKRYNQPVDATALLKSRRDQFGDQVDYLGAITSIGAETLPVDELIDLTLKQLTRADNAEEIDQVLHQTNRTFSSKDKRASLITTLEKRPQLSLAEACLYSRALYRNGEKEKAHEILESHHTEVDEPAPSIILRQQLELYRADKDWEQAVRIGRVLYHTPDGKTSRNAKVLFDLLRKAKAHDEAHLIIADWKQLSPGSVSPWKLEADLLAEAGQSDDAIALLRKAAHRFPDDTDLERRLAKIYFDVGEFGESTRIYWSLYDRAENTSVQLSLIEDLHKVAVQIGIPADLLSTLEARQRSNPTAPKTQLALAEYFRLSEELAREEQHLIYAVRLAPTELPILRRLARFQYRHGKINESIRTQEKILALDHDPKTKLTIAKLHLEGGNVSKGYHLLTSLDKEIATPDQTLDLIAEEVGDLMIKNQDYEVAIEYLATYLPQFPDNYRLRYLRAIAQEENGDLEQAAHAFLELATWESEMERPLSESYSEEERRYILKNYLSSIEGYSRYYDLLSRKDNAYQHVYQSSRYRSPLERLRVLPPLDVSAARYYALLHLLVLADQIDHATLASRIESAFEINGIDSYHTLVPLARLSITPHQQLNNEFILANLNDPHFLSYWGLILTNTSETEVSRETFVSAIEHTKEEHPMLSAIFTLQGLLFYPKHDWNLHLSRAISHLAETSWDSPQAQLASYSLCEMLVNPSQAAMLPQDTLDRIHSSLHELVLSRSFDSDETIEKTYALLLMSYYLKKSNLVEFGNLIRKIESGSDSGIDYKDFYYTAICYGPAHFRTTSWPPIVRAFFHSTPSDTDRNHLLPKDFEVDSILPHLDSPIIQLLAINQTSAKEKTLEFASELERQATISSDDLIAIAKLYDHHNEPAKALRAMSAARKRSDDPHLQDSLDGAIAHLAIDVGGENPQSFTEGQEALIRTSHLWHQVWNISNYLEKLDLTHQSNMASKKIASNRNFINRTYRTHFQSPKTVQIERAISSGNRQKAIDTATQALLEACAPAVYRRSHQWTNKFYAYQQVMRAHPNLNEEVIRQLEQRCDKAPTRRKLEIAMAADLAGDSKLSSRIYREILATHPNDRIAKALRISALIRAKQESKAYELLNASPDSHIAPILGLINNFNTNHPTSHRDLDVQLEFAKLGFSQVDRIPKETASYHLYGLKKLFTELAFGSKYGLPAIHDRNDYDGDKPEYFDIDLSADERDQLIRPFLDSAFRIDGLQGLCFSFQAAIALKEGKELEHFNTIATEILAQASTSLTQTKPNRLNASYSNHTMLYQNYEYSQVLSPLLSPHQFLIRNEALNGEPDQIAPLIAATPIDDRKRARSYSQLYTCKPEDFPDVSSAHAELGDKYGGTESHINEILWAAEDRKLSYETLNQTMKAVVPKTNRHYERPEWIHLLFHVSSQSQAYPGKEATLRDFTQAWFVEEMDGIRTKVLAEYKANNGTLNHRGPASGLLNEVIPYVIKDPTYFIPALTVLEDGGYKIDDFFASLPPVDMLFSTTHATRLTSMFNSSTWFGDIEKIRFYSYNYRNQERRMFLAQMLQSHTDDESIEHLQLALKNTPESFLKDFLILYINKNQGPKIEAMLSLIGEHLEAFSALPDEKLDEWFSFFEQIKLTNQFIEYTGDEDSAASRAANWFGERQLKKIDLIRQQLADAKSTSDISPDPDEFEEQLCSVVARTISLSPQEAAKVFFTGWNLINIERRQKGWDGNQEINGWSGPTDLAETILRRDQHGLQGAAFYCELLRLDTKGEVPHSGWASKFLCIGPINEIIEASGGIERPEESLPILFDQIAEAIGEDPERYSDILSITYVSIIKKLSPNHLVSAIAAADEISRSGSAGARHALNFAMAGRFVAESTSVKRFPESQRSKIPDLPAWRDHALEQLSDGSKRGSYLIPMAHAYARSMPPQHSDPELSIEGGRIIANALKHRHSFNGFGFIQILKNFSEHSDHPEWTEVAEALRQQWWDWCQHHQFASSQLSNQWMISSMTMGMMDALLRLDDPDGFSRFQKEFGSKLRESFFDQVPLILVKCGQFEAAGDLLRKDAHRFNNVFRSRNSVWYAVTNSQAFEEQVAEFVQTLEDPQEAAFARAFLSSIPDPKFPTHGIAPPPTRPLGERLHSAATEINKTKWTNDLLRHQTLQYLVQNAATIPQLNEQLTSLSIAPLIRTALQTKNVGLIRARMKLPVASALASFEAGDAEPFQQFLKIIHESSSSERYKIAAYAGSSEMISAHLRHLAPQLSDDSFAAYSPLLQQFLRNTIWMDHIAYRDKVICAWLASAARSGTLEEVDSWLADLPNEERKAMIDSLQGHWSTLIHDFASFLPPRNKQAAPLQADSRIRQIQELLRLPLVQRGLRFRSQELELILHQFIQSKAITREEVLQHADLFYEAWPDQGIIAFELATLAKESSDQKACLKWGQLAIETLDPNTKRPAEIYANAVVTHAENLHEFGKPEEAKQILANFPKKIRGKKGATHKKRAAELRKKLSTQGAI